PPLRLGVDHPRHDVHPMFSRMLQDDAHPFGVEDGERFALMRRGAHDLESGIERGRTGDKVSQDAAKLRHRTGFGGVASSDDASVGGCGAPFPGLDCGDIPSRVCQEEAREADLLSALSALLEMYANLTSVDSRQLVQREGAEGLRRWAEQPLEPRIKCQTK